MSWPKRLKNAASAVSTATAASASCRPRSESTRHACGRMLMPTPSALICGADSNTRQPMPRWCSSSARVRPPIPAPMMRMSSILLVYCEVRLFQGSIADDFIGRTARRDAAALEHVRAVGERERERAHLVDEQDGRRFAPQTLERGEEILDHRGREAERRLVEQEAFRPRHKPARDRLFCGRRRAPGCAARRAPETPAALPARAPARAALRRARAVA